MVIPTTGAHTHNQRAVLKRYPPTSGLTAETTKQEGRIENLKAEEGSLVNRRDKAGITGL